jgi:hypothetical protein
MGGRAEEVGRGESFAIRAVATAFAGSVFLAGALTLRTDLIVAFREADPRVFPPAFSQQVRRVEKIAPPRAELLVVASPDDAWRARLWQRALYPRNPVVVRYRPLPSGGELEELRRFAAFVVALGAEVPELPLSSEERLGGENVWIGTLRR